jgi:hypothetical protein
MAEFQITTKILEVAPEQYLVTVTALPLDVKSPAEHASRIQGCPEQATKAAAAMEEEMRYRLARKGHKVILNNDAAVSSEFAQQLRAAHDRLSDEMQRNGLLARDGWKIAQHTRDVTDGSELVLRPLHTQLGTPSGMECIVRVAEGGSVIERECRCVYPPVIHRTTAGR